MVDENPPSPGTDAARPMRLGLLGCGNVGGALVQLVAERRLAVAARTGLDLQVTRVAVRSPARARGVDLPAAALTSDPGSIVDDPDIDVVVEVMGGIEPARDLILRALKSGKPVVTANKELLANHGVELFAAADAAGVDLLFEAAVAGGIPLMRPLRESLIGEPIERVMGIVNGTTNYILTRMTESGATYHDALAEAQSLGYAERDPTADVEGYDAGAKAAIIAMVAFGTPMVAGDVYHEGISGITAADIEVAGRLGYCVKLLAIAELHTDRGEPEVGVRVHPAMVPVHHPLAAVRDSFNAVFVEGAAVGDLMFYGRGAGGLPTASAVLGDVIDAAANLRRGTHASIGTFRRATIRPIDDVVTAYYLSLDVVDQPGVLAQVATVFGDHGVSIRSMEQVGLDHEARLIFITHVATERDLQATLHDLRELDVVDRVGSVLRVVGA
jgi:homoserine dehydrogenase